MQNISLLEAWSYVASFPSYWIWLVISLAVAGVGGKMLYKSNETDGWSAGKSIAVFVLAAIVLFALLSTPCEVAANTTIDMMHRGVYIGR